MGLSELNKCYAGAFCVTTIREKKIVLTNILLLIKSAFVKGQPNHLTAAAI